MQNLSLNGFQLELSAKTLTLYKLAFPDNKGLRTLRAAHTDWFVYWREGTVYALPNVANPTVKLGAETTDLLWGSPRLGVHRLCPLSSKQTNLSAPHEASAA